jgi:hypothetical protein
VYVLVMLLRSSWKVKMDEDTRRKGGGCGPAPSRDASCFRPPTFRRADNVEQYRAHQPQSRERPARGRAPGKRGVAAATAQETQLAFTR